MRISCASVFLVQIFFWKSDTCRLISKKWTRLWKSVIEVIPQITISEFTKSGRDRLLGGSLVVLTNYYVKIKMIWDFGGDYMILVCCNEISTSPTGGDFLVQIFFWKSDTCRLISKKWTRLWKSVIEVIPQITISEFTKSGRDRLLGGSLVVLTNYYVKIKMIWDFGGDYMILVCCNEISTSPIGADFTLRLHGKIKFHLLRVNGFPPGICSDLFTFSFNFFCKHVFIYCFIPLWQAETT